MRKHFWQLKKGEQFHIGDGWDLIKLGLFKYRAAHVNFINLHFFKWPWEIVETIEPNPNCTKKCACKNL